MRADSAFYSRQVLGACRRHDVRFSVTVRQDRRVRRAIEAIPEQAWTPIPYWLSTPEVSGADVAEVPYRCHAGRHAITVRLIVRRVRPTPGSQLALFTTWDYHAFVTDRDGDLLDLEADHRRHAIVEQVIADLKAVRWRTCPRAGLPPTLPGWLWPVWPTTSAAGAPPSPTWDGAPSVGAAFAFPGPSPASGRRAVAMSGDRCDGRPDHR